MGWSWCLLITVVGLNPSSLGLHTSWATTLGRVLGLRPTVHDAEQHEEEDRAHEEQVEENEDPDRTPLEVLGTTILGTEKTPEDETENEPHEGTDHGDPKGLLPLILLVEEGTALGTLDCGFVAALHTAPVRTRAGHFV